jgi:hypothetical protein
MGVPLLALGLLGGQGRPGVRREGRGLELLHGLFERRAAARFLVLLRRQRGNGRDAREHDACLRGRRTRRP